MKILISPAKKMNIHRDVYRVCGMPVFLEKAERLMTWIRGLSRETLKELWKCNDRLVGLNMRRFADMELQNCLTPAVISYEGIQFQYMAPLVMNKEQLAYIGENLRILSGFYGVLRPFDGVTPYRLEMQARHKTLAFPGGCKDLYEYWQDDIYRELTNGKEPIVNLASKEYFKAVKPYMTEEDRMITCIFGELRVDGTVIQKGTMAKMARGEMVNYLADVRAQSFQEIKGFDRLGYVYQEALSSEREYVFIREEH